MSLVTITQAAELAGISRSHFHRHYVKSGKISVQRDKDNKPQVDTAEVLRVFGELKATPRNSEATLQATPSKHHTITHSDQTQNLVKIAELETENRLIKQQLKKVEQQETWYKQHRGVTHYVMAWVVALAFALLLWDFHGILAAFFWGGLTHVLADSMTVTGVPFAPNSDRRFHLFGGRLRTGQSGEYAVAWGIVAVCAVAMQLVNTSGNWYPFFYDWSGLYEEGIIDGKEWKDNRFRFF